MIDRLRRLWRKAAESPGESREHDVSLAVAALMVEVMRMDDRLDDAEHIEIMAALAHRFDLSDSEIHGLINQARDETASSTDLHQFTSQIIKGFTMNERADIIRQLWRIAMADGHVDPYEELLIRRIAELVGVDHRQFIKAKIDARRS
jgi:uncharacterized tellurite resistance protein B-like protein